MKDYTFRAMEIHDFTQIWNLDEIRRRLDFMVKNNMNAMVFHEPGIEDKCIFRGRSSDLKSCIERKSESQS